MKDELTGRPRRPEAAPAPGPNVITRRAGIDDYSSIRHIQASAIRSLGSTILDEAEVETAIRTVYSSSYISELLAKTVLVASVNGDMVASCAWGPSDDRGAAARISALFVMPLFQGKGIGRTLVSDAEKDAGTNGFSRFTATVPVAAVPLFAASGYIIASYGTSRDVVPGTAIQVAFLRKPN